MFVKVKRLFCVFYDVFSVFNELYIFFWLVVDMSVGVFFCEGVVFIIFWEFEVYFVNGNFFFERRL